MIFLRRFILCIFFICFFNASLKARGAFQTYGDIFQFLPLFAATYSLAIKDYYGLGHLAIGVGSTFAITYASKYTFVAIAQSHPNIAAISKRPDNTGYDGFPSGHSASAFSAAGFMQRRYGYKLGVPTTVLATLVAISRIKTKRHTITQAITGAILGYGLSYLFTSKYHSNTNIQINTDTETLANGKINQRFFISLFHRF